VRNGLETSYIYIPGSCRGVAFGSTLAQRYYDARMEHLRHPGFSGPVAASRSTLSDDPDTAVAQTIAVMARLAREDSASPDIVRLANQMRGGSMGETIQHVWNWIRMRVRFVQDRDVAAAASGNNSEVAEVLIRPVALIRMQDAQGDCDDFSTLGAAIFRALSIPVVFCTVAADASAPDQYSHVYLRVAGDAFDSSHGSYLGWEAPNRFGKLQMWSVEDGMPLMRGGVSGGVSLSGLGLDTSAPTPWWQNLINQTLPTGLSILSARYGVPPEGTLIQTQAGVVSRTGAASPVLGPGAVSTIPTWMWAAAALAVLLLVTRGGKK